jgi:cysteinyl-tRNA synthetase
MKTGSEKMSKSKGNEIVVSELLKKHQPETLRFFLLATHYRRPIDFSEERLSETARGLAGFYRFFERYQRITGSSFHELVAPSRRAPFVGAEGLLTQVAQYRDSFLEHMDDDFNTGGAIGILYELLTALNRFADSAALEESATGSSAVADFRAGALVLRELSKVLGLFDEPQAKPAPEDEGLLNSLMQIFIDLRADARKAKNFTMADQIRQRLASLGVTLEDRPGGTGWRLEQ